MRIFTVLNSICHSVSMFFSINKSFEYSLSLSLSLSLSACLSHCLSVSLSLSVYLSLCLSLFLSPSHSLSPLCLSLSMLFYLCLSACARARMRAYACVNSSLSVLNLFSAAISIPYLCLTIHAKSTSACMNLIKVFAFLIHRLCILLTLSYLSSSDRQDWAISIDQDQTPQKAASDQGLCCLPFNHPFLDVLQGDQMDLFKAWGKYGKL